MDDKTSLQPRTRTAPPLAAQPGQPGRVAHAYTRQGARHRLAGCDTRTGKGDATTAERQRQRALLALLEHVHREVASGITTMHVVLDHRRMHKGKPGQAWLAKPPRFVCHFPPVQGSWLHQVAQWFALLQRKRWPIADFADKQPRAERLLAFVADWKTHAHPLRWSTKSVAQVMAKCESPLAEAA